AASGGALWGSTQSASSRMLNTTQSTQLDEIVSSGPPGHVSRGSDRRSRKQSSQGPGVGSMRRPVAIPSPSRSYIAPGSNPNSSGPPPPLPPREPGGQAIPG